MTLADHANERDKIVDAAIRCFERFGPQRTSMNDIADEAGISRRTLYRQFDDRPALVAEILDRRLSELHASVVAHLATYDDIEAALIEGSLFSVEAGEADELVAEIVRHEHAGTPERFLLRVNDAIAARVLESWSAVLGRGRAQGRVRTELSDTRVVELIMTVHTVALLRDDLGRNGRRALFRDLLVASVLRQPA
ncbi:TetR/AcrR family transcriptional regulator [Candidatus Poriferisodalis sp.]|uniref:TetR/AcrR family transcriptional regulator n=1 Tax=Candidatus Poriferisodalis sp. TaxID=3101277 RepID=UPI003B011BF8